MRKAWNGCSVRRPLTALSTVAAEGNAPEVRSISNPPSRTRPERSCAMGVIILLQTVLAGWVVPQRPKERRPGCRALRVNETPASLRYARIYLIDYLALKQQRRPPRLAHRPVPK